jgi:preprotein translocase subunit SecG
MTLETLTNESLNLAATSLTMAQVNPVVINLLVGVFLLISIVMILIVLIQRPQGGGLGGAFGAGGGGGGGGGAGQTAFGTKTGDVLTGGTIAIFVLFIVFAIVLNFVTRPPEAQLEQPTLSAPGTTEPIPVDESDESIEDAVDTGLERAGDAVEDAGEAVDDLTEDLGSETQPEADPQDGDE